MIIKNIRLYFEETSRKTLKELRVIDWIIYICIALIFAFFASFNGVVL